MNMSETGRNMVWSRLPEGLVMVRGSQVNRLSVRALKSAGVSFVLALAVTDLPDEVQFLVSQLAIAGYFRMVAILANPATAFVLWTLTIAALFSGSLVFAYFSWGDRRAKASLLLAPGSVASTPPTPSTVAGIPLQNGARQTIESISTETSKEQMQGRVAQAGVSVLSPVRPS